MSTRDKDSKVAYTNPRTGITTYSAAPTDAAAQAQPSTDTSLPPASGTGAQSGTGFFSDQPRSDFFAPTPEQLAARSRLNFDLAGTPRALREGFQYRDAAPAGPFDNGTQAGYYRLQPGAEGNPDSYQYVGNGAPTQEDLFAGNPTGSIFRPATYAELSAAGLGDFSDLNGPAWQTFSGGRHIDPLNSDRSLERAVYNLMGMGFSSNDLSSAFRGIDPNLGNSIGNIWRGQAEATARNNAPGLFDQITGAVMSPQFLAPLAFGVLTPGALPALVNGLSEATGLGTGALGTAGKLGYGMLTSGSTDIGQAAKNLGIGEAIGAGADFAAPYASKAFDSAKGMLPFSTAADQLPDVPAAISAPTALGLPIGPQAPAGLVGPASSPGMGASVIPGAATPGLDLGMLGQTLAGEPGAEQTQPQGVTPQAAAQPSVSSADLQRYAKIGQGLYKLLGANSQIPQGAPQRAAPADAATGYTQQENAQYAQQLEQYAATTGGFNEKALKGLTPGTPEYYSAVMGQMDSVINRIAGNLDMNASDLSAQLRGKSAKELDDLQRALYVRGQMGTLMGSGQYTDPFSGESQQIDANDQLINPGVAAYQRGLASRAEQFAGEAPNAAYAGVQDLLNRNPDLFGMQAAADRRRLAEEYAAQGIYPRRKRGFEDVNSMSPDELMALLGY